MAASKYWGDEKSNEAIYSIYLKKVRYVPPSQYEGLPHYRPIDPDSHHLGEELGGPDHLQWETIRERVIKAGTLEKLVESLIGAEERLDSRQFNVFFATYRAFSEPEAVLDKLISWFTSLDQQHNRDSRAHSSFQGTQSTIRSILVCWLDTYPEDFYYHDTSNHFPLLGKLIDFSRSRNLYDLKHKARKVRERFKRILEDGGMAAQIPSIHQYAYGAVRGYDPNDYVFAQQRAQMFDVGRDNCVQIAEQLTFWDAVLFKELRPYQCQGAIWGKRHKKHPDTVYSVKATIDQFNALSHRVMTSIVLPECRHDFRAKIIEKWIEISRELRSLKNFSSLKAVLSSLQSEPVFRLKSVWALVSKVSMSNFKELSSIFELDENGDELKARHILDSEGTAKSSPLRRPQTLQNCRRTKSDVNLAVMSECQGTVPYLGTFLTDLTMLDQAHFDSTPEGLINFEKRRREFEVLAKIRLFQSAARAYTIPMDQAFCVWFFYLPCLKETECFNRSLEVEPIPASVTPETRRRTGASKLTNGFYGSPGARIQSLTRMFANITTFGEPEETPSSSLPAGQSSNDSGINTAEESWNGGSPNEQMVAMALLTRGGGRVPSPASPSKQLRDRSSTAPSTPAGTISFRRTNYSGSEFNPNSLLFCSHSSHANTCGEDGSPSTCNGYLTTSDSTPLRTLSRSSQNSRRPYDSTKSANGTPSKNSAGCSSPSLTRSATPSMGDHTATDSPNYMIRTRNRINGNSQTSQKSNNSSTNSSNRSSSYDSSSNTNYGGTTTSSTQNTISATGGTINFHLARVGLDDDAEGSESTTITTTNYKCIKVENGDRMTNLIERALEKHLIDTNERANYALVQLLPDGSEFTLPDHCNPFYAVAPDATSPMLNFVLRKRDQFAARKGVEAKRMVNRQKRSTLLRWSSGYL